MCLIIVGLKKNITENWCKIAWNANKDGAGIVICGSIPRIYKGLMTYDTFKSTFDRISDNSYIAVHFRMGTHGKVNPKNTHPFKIDDNNYLMHNGILFGLGSQGQFGSSDSAHLAKILSQLRPYDRNALLNTLSGRFAIIGKTIKLYGDWKRYNNCYHSNPLLVPFTPAVMTNYGYDGNHLSNSSKSWLDEYNALADTKTRLPEHYEKIAKNDDKVTSILSHYTKEEQEILKEEAKELGYDNVDKYLKEELLYDEKDKDGINEFCVAQCTKENKN